MAEASAPPAKPKAKTKETAKETGDKKPRAPRQDYGFAKSSIIHVTDKEVKYRGKRLEWYERLKKANGKTCEKFLTDNATDPKDPPRGWLRFFVQDGAAELETVTEAT